MLICKKAERIFFMTQQAVFARYSPAIRNYVYAQNWRMLRDVQTAAGEALFNRDAHLLLGSGTAAGKTEAAFLPCLTLLEENPAHSVGILYVSPLKALINDQFERLEKLMDALRVPVTKWHGDAGAAQKKRLLENPGGVLQITPESLENLLRRGRDAQRLFCDLRFCVIDELHSFCGTPRGTQLQAVLVRLERLTGCTPRRIGLSATLGAGENARLWLVCGGTRPCVCPKTESPPRRFDIGLDYFARDEEGASPALIERLYDLTLGRKTLLFTRSRREAEDTAARLKETAKLRGSPDVYRVHHGSLSAQLRENTEREMREDTLPIVTAATHTLELGLDIGSLSQVVQRGAPTSVSALTQRMGRCGRQGQRSRLFFALEEELDETGVDWEFIKAVATLRLCLEEQWTEPAAPSPRRPFGVLFQQTLALLVQNGGAMPPAALCRAALTLPPFAAVTQDDYRLLLRHMLETQMLAPEEDGLLRVGAAGETLVNHRDFCAVFAADEEYAVRAPGGDIGTVSGDCAPGCLFALAGQVWRVTRRDDTAKVLHVLPAQGAAESVWDAAFHAPLHERVAHVCREILDETRMYPFLSAAAKLRLESFRAAAAQIGLTKQRIVRVGAAGICVFPWLGSLQLAALQAALRSEGIPSDIRAGAFTPLYLRVREIPRAEERIRAALHHIRRHGPGSEELPLPPHPAPRTRYDAYLPKSLRDAQMRDALFDTDFSI
jgi:ATP-dependent Lhr-like helicase